jgi:hypothetical protein
MVCEDEAIWSEGDPEVAAAVKADSQSSPSFSWVCCADLFLLSLVTCK